LKAKQKKKMADGDFLEYMLGPIAPIVPDVQITGDAEGKLVQTWEHYMPLISGYEKRAYVENHVVYFDFVERRRTSQQFMYNEATYKDEIVFGFYFHVGSASITIAVVMEESDRERLQRKEKFPIDLIKSLAQALLAGTKDERTKKLEADIALAWEELFRFPAFRSENIKVVENAEDFSVNVSSNFNPVSVTTLKNSDMFLIKFQDHGDESRDVLGVFSTVLNKTAELQQLKHPKRAVFTDMSDAVKESNLILALFTRAKKKGGAPFWEMNGYALCKMHDPERKILHGKIKFLQSFIPDAMTQQQYHKVGKSNLFGTMLISLAENIIFQEGAESVVLDPLSTAVSFYVQLGYKHDQEGMRKVFPRKTRGVFNASSFDLWGPIIENRWRQKDIEAALRLVRGNTVAAAQLMHFYLKKRGKLI
jgi:hypothetical protein